MSEQWAAEITVDEEESTALIEAQFPELRPVEIEPLDHGWDSLAYVVNGEYVFRFPRRALGAACLEVEICGLPLIADALPIPVPALTFVGEATHEFPWRFMAHKYLPGQTADRAILTDKERIDIARPLGIFLHSLHDLDPSHELPGDWVGRLDVSRRTPVARALLDSSVGQSVSEKDAEQLRTVLDTADTLRAPMEATIVHGDLYSKQILIGEDRAVSGIIDWGDMHLGDPAIDLAVVWTLLPAQARPIFFDAYGEFDEETIRLARWRALAHTLIVVDYSNKTNETDLYNEAVASLERIANTG